MDDYGPEVMINVEVWLVPGFNLEGWIGTRQVEVLGPLGPVGRFVFVDSYICIELFFKQRNTFCPLLKKILNWKNNLCY